ncbi:hypothetical protein Tco_0679697 [Tanacetum coccineum]|uniref:Uncharacterized protein n=1 Tax=Tanacetum coccineum TaxID=301880 RepID=A0ABQ4XJK1_9ASTR
MVVVRRFGNIHWGVSSSVDAFVRLGALCKFGISSWRCSRVSGRSFLLSVMGSVEVVRMVRITLLSVKAGMDFSGFLPCRRIGFRMELVQGATPICEGSCRLTSLERKEVWNDCRSCKVRVGSNGQLFGKGAAKLLAVKISCESLGGCYGCRFVGIQGCNFELTCEGRTTGLDKYP